jgi:ABC-2 type transport system ATP-binding protein
MTIILTTHYMDEADQLCSRIAIIDWGEIVALGTSEELKADLGGDVVELGGKDLRQEFVEHLKRYDDLHSASIQDGRLVLTVASGESFVPRVFDTAHALGVKISAVSVRKPNLEDVFIQLTGREIRDEGVKEPKERMRIYMRVKQR